MTNSIERTSCLRRSTSKPTNLLLLLLLTALLSGCLFAPVIQEIQGFGMGPGDRQNKLSEDSRTFLDALYWKRAGLALGYAKPEFRDELKSILRGRSADERIVESRVDFIDFDEESYAAEVEVVVRYYIVPYYVVEERREIHNWSFSLGTGWKIAKIRLV